MSGPPPGSGACCPPQAQGVTYVRIGSQGAVVGMIGLAAVFQQLLAMGRGPGVATDEELVGMARSLNWIPSNPRVEAEYASALRAAYASFVARQEKDGGRQ